MLRETKVTLAFFVILALAATSADAEFTDDFEGYAPGEAVIGLNGWAGWLGADDPATVTDTRAYSGKNSLRIGPGSDLVQQLDITSGVWQLTAMQYVPSGSQGKTYFNLLDNYTPGPEEAELHWSGQVRFNMSDGEAVADKGNLTASLITDQWVELKMIIDVDNRLVDTFYGDTQIHNGRFWGEGNDWEPALAVIDLFHSGTSSPVYWDALHLTSAQLVGTQGDTLTPTPEPSTLVMLLGLAAAGLLLRTRLLARRR